MFNLLSRLPDTEHIKRDVPHFVGLWWQWFWCIAFIVILRARHLERVVRILSLKFSKNNFRQWWTFMVVFVGWLFRLTAYQIPACCYNRTWWYTKKPKKKRDFLECEKEKFDTLFIRDKIQRSILVSRHHCNFHFIKDYNMHLEFNPFDSSIISVYLKGWERSVTRWFFNRSKHIIVVWWCCSFACYLV